MTCTGCQRENPDDARFCNGCGQPLREAPPQRDPRDYTPRHLAERILQQRAALEGERKQVSVLFADIKGSMDLAEQLDPESWHGILDRYFQILAAGVHRNEGTINQYTGDGVMALFGAPLAHEDHAQRACAAALTLQAELAALSRELSRELGIELETRMGISSGEVVVGRIGDDLRMDYTAQGHTVGMAHRVEQLARAGRSYLTEETARIVRGYFELRDLGARELKGASGRTRVFELVGPGALRTRLDRSRQQGFSPFVGREQELAELGQALAAAAAGEGRVVALVAEPGTGKSRLAQELVDRARAAGATVREVHALAQDRDVPLHAIGLLVRSSLGVGAADGPEVVRATVRARMQEIGAEDPDAVALVCDFLDAPDPERPLPALDPDARRRRLEDPLVRIVTTSPAAAVAATLLRVEDLHWVDAASAALLARIADGLTRAAASERPGALLLLTSRPMAAPEPLLERASPRIALSLLDSEDADRLAADWLGPDASVAELGRRVAEAAGGNPLFIEEILRSLLEAGALAGARGACRLEVPLTQVTLPDTVQSVLAARIDRLPEREKQVLQAAAVLGRAFESALLVPVLGLASQELAGALDTLERSEFLAPARAPERREFRHPLTQEVAYQTLLGGRRRALHAAAARALAEEHASGARDRAALLAFHHEAAGELFEAARWYEHSGRRIARTDTDAGMHHCRKACELLDALPADEASRTLGLTSRIAVLEIGRMAGIDGEEAERTFASAQEIADELGDRRGAAFLQSAYGRLQGLAGDVDRYRELAERAVAIAGGSDDPRLLFEMRASLLHAQIGVGALREADALAQELLAQLDADPALSASESTAPELVRLRAGWLCAYRGRFDDAEELLRPRDGSDAAQHRWDTLYGACGLRCELSRLRGDPLAALGNGRRAARIAEGVGGTFARVEAGAFFGHALLRAGDVPAADQTLREALALARERGTALWYETRLLACLAQASLAQGDLALADRQAREAVAIAEAGRGWRIGACDAHLARARVALAASEPGEAREALARAEAVEQATGAVVYRAELVHLAARLAGEVR